MAPEQIVKLAETFGEHRDLKLSTIGVYAARDGRFITRLKEGGDSGSRVLRRTVQWCSDHWPDDLEWPRDIERPEPMPKKRAS